jgi:two-component system sensor histidine kinase RegB
MSLSLRRREQELASSRARAEASERLGALGTLAASTAHQLNTPLGTIALLAEGLAEQLEGDPREEAQAIRKQVRRCKEIITSLLSPSDAAQEPEEVLLAELLETTLHRWCEGRPQPLPRLAVAPEVRTARARLPRADFERAVANLLDNAHEATSNGEAPRISVLLERIEPERLRLTVEDNGVGVPEELMNRVGEPFFTTKGPGRGSGLGLYLARQLVERQGGGMRVRSTEGKGTRVELLIPET